MVGVVVVVVVDVVVADGGGGGGGGVASELAAVKVGLTMIFGVLVVVEMIVVLLFAGDLSFSSWCLCWCCC